MKPFFVTFSQQKYAIGLYTEHYKRYEIKVKNITFKQYYFCSNLLF